MPKSKASTNGHLKPDPHNARKHGDRNKALIRASLQEVGGFRSIAVDGTDTIRAGNGVYEQAKELGMTVRIIDAAPDELIAVRRKDLKGKKAERAALLDNRAGELSEWDDAVIAEIAANERELLDGMFSDKELRDLLGNEALNGDAPEAQIDKAAELQAKWKVAPGDIWQIGRHRLMCGDSTSKDDVTRLMDGRKAAMLWTDPPYGVSYVGKTKDALTIQNDGAEDLPGLLYAAFHTADDVLEDGAPIYVAHPPGALQFTFGQAFLEVGWKFHEELVWVKDSMVLGHSDYHLKHEGIHYGWKGTNRKWFAGRDAVSVLEVARPKRSEQHPTMKPPELVGICLSNSTERDNAVLDLFNGSGTTLVACEQLGRIGYGMEIEPKYCAVTLERLQAMGLTPVRCS